MFSPLTSEPPTVCDHRPPVATGPGSSGSRSVSRWRVSSIWTSTTSGLAFSAADFGVGQPRGEAVVGDGVAVDDLRADGGGDRGLPAVEVAPVRANRRVGGVERSARRGCAIAGDGSAVGGCRFVGELDDVGAARLGVRSARQPAQQRHDRQRCVESSHRVCPSKVCKRVMGQTATRRRAMPPTTARPSAVSSHCDGSGTGVSVRSSIANWPRSVLNAEQLPDASQAKP